MPFPLLPFDGRELWPFGGEMCPFPLAFGRELWPFDVGEVRPLPLPLPLASSSSSCCVRDFFFSARRMWRSCDPHMSWEEDRGSVTGMGVEDLYKGKPTLRFEDSPRELQRTRTYTRKNSLWSRQAHPIGSNTQPLSKQTRSNLPSKNWSEVS